MAAIVCILGVQQYVDLFLAALCFKSQLRDLLHSIRLARLRQSATEDKAAATSTKRVF